MHSIEQRIKTWADDRIPGRDIPSRLRKLGEEHGEFTEAVARYSADPSEERARFAAKEAADVTLVLADTLSLMGVSLFDAITIKMTEIEGRPKGAVK